MDGEDFVPVLFAHVVEGGIPQDAGVADDDVQAAEVVDRSLHHVEAAVVAGDRIVVGGSLSTSGFDLVYDLLGGGGVFALAVRVAAEVVDDDLCAALCEVEGVGPAETVAGASDQGHLAFE